MNQPAFGPNLGEYGFVPKPQKNWTAILLAAIALVIGFFLAFFWKKSQKAENAEFIAKKLLEEEKANGSFPKKLGL